MPKTRTAIQMFLASPSDVAEERLKVQEVVGELNRTIGRNLGFFLELLRWEEFVPGMGRPEQVILDQADLDSSDLFVGILWNRFGTDTGKAASGTEEEFNLAYEFSRASGKPHILLYFCARPANLDSEEQLRQRSQVVAFRGRTSRLGLIRQYGSAVEFESVLRGDLTNHLLRAAPLFAPVASQGRTPIAEPVPSQRRTQNDHVPAPPRNTIHIRAGRFLSGRSSEPASIERDYYIDEVPVTNSAFLTFMEESQYLLALGDPSSRDVVKFLRWAAANHPDHPVTMVTWNDAQAYAAWVGKRLPTALEWERAARGPKGRSYPWGNDFDPRVCNSGESGVGQTTPVYGFPGGRSAEGCFDLAGNVFEWVSDWATAPRFSTVRDSEKINRGGSYNRGAPHLLAWHTESDPPDLRMRDVGFRCAWPPESSD